MTWNRGPRNRPCLIDGKLWISTARNGYVSTTRNGYVSTTHTLRHFHRWSPADLGRWVWWKWDCWRNW